MSTLEDQTAVENKQANNIAETKSVNIPPLLKKKEKREKKRAFCCLGSTTLYSLYTADFPADVLNRMTTILNMQNTDETSQLPSCCMCVGLFGSKLSEPWLPPWFSVQPVAGSIFWVSCGSEPEAWGQFPAISLATPKTSLPAVYCRSPRSCGEARTPQDVIRLPVGRTQCA